MVKVRLVALIVIVAVTLAPLLEAAGQTNFLLAPTWVYDFVPLDVPGAINTGAEGINNHNEIAGWFFDGSVGRSFVLSNGVFTPLAMEGANTTIARDINDDGSVVGEFQLNGHVHAFRHSAGTFSEPFGVGNFGDAYARGINNQGAVVGAVWSQDFDVGLHLSGYFDGDYLEDVWFSGINEARHAVGTDLTAPVDGVWRGFLVSTDVTFLAYRGAAQTDPDDVNNLDTVVGSYYASDTLHGFVWTNGKFVSIDYPGADVTVVTGINDAGIIVGHYRAGSQLHGFVGIPRSPLKVLINGAEGSVTLDRTQPLRVDLAFQAPLSGALDPAELYIGVVAPNGVWWLNSAGAFVATPTRIFAGPLPAFGPSHLINLPNASALQPGMYTWFMVADDDTNGVPNGAFFDLAALTVH